MERIFPMEEANIRNYVGRPICAVLQDGSYFYGHLREIQDGQILLTSGAQGEGTISTNAAKAKAQLSAQSRKANTSAWGYPGYGYGGAWAITLPLILLALLFAFPFGFFW